MDASRVHSDGDQCVFGPAAIALHLKHRRIRLPPPWFTGLAVSSVMDFL
jgi:hypothetical protein